MRERRAARTVHLCNLAQAARPRRSALRAGRACRTGARACRADAQMQNALEKIAEINLELLNRRQLD
jgi:hypothetical protein